MSVWEQVDYVECDKVEGDHEEFFECEISVVDEDGEVEKVEQEIGGYQGDGKNVNLDLTTNNYGPDFTVAPGNPSVQTFAECRLEGTRSGLGRRNVLRCSK